MNTSGKNSPPRGKVVSKKQPETPKIYLPADYVDRIAAVITRLENLPEPEDDTKEIDLYDVAWGLIVDEMEKIAEEAEIQIAQKIPTTKKPTKTYK